ncbi:MAG: OmpA family protein [bacterium]
MRKGTIPERKSIETHWTSLADLMSGLMLIFLLISIIYSSQKEIVAEKSKKRMSEIDKIVQQYKNTQKAIYEALKEEFINDLKKWNAELDSELLSVRFNVREGIYSEVAVPRDIYFDVGKAIIKKEFKDVIDDFWPRFLKILKQKRFKDEIEEIRIEGHTSSEWLTQVDPDSAYMLNMELSQDRARSVLSYVLKINTNRVDREWAKSKLTANGLSSSKLIYNKTGEEDKKRSRRVEFRVKTKSEEKIYKIIERLKKD